MLPGFKERKELELAQMRARQQAAKRAAQVAHITAINPYRETIERNQKAAREAADLKAGKRHMTPEQLQGSRREAVSFSRMTWYLKAQRKAVLAERRITAFHGCKTSWPRIEAHAMYCVVAQAPARKDGDPAHYGSERAKDSRGSKSNGGSNQLGRAVPSVRVVR